MMIDPRFTPHSSARAGLSSRIVLLALASLGAGLFLFVVLPWLTTSNAAEVRTHPLRDTAAPAQGDVASNGVELAPALDTPGAVEETPAVAEAQTSVVGSAAGGVPGASALVASEMVDTGPKLRHLRGGGKAPKTTNTEIHAAQREKRQQQRASGIDPKAAQAAARAAAKAAGPNPNRDRIKSAGGDSSRAQAPGKGRRRSRKQVPAGG